MQLYLQYISCQAVKLIRSFRIAGVCDENAISYYPVGAWMRVSFNMCSDIFYTVNDDG